VAETGYIFRVEICNTRLGGMVFSLFVKPSAAKAVYYCPMHPSYTSDKPGTCPICNMSLEKLEPEQTAREGKPATGETAPSGKRKILYYQDAMNPANKSDKPGKAPDGMDLIPVYEEEPAAGEAVPAGSVKINPQKQQLIGVQYSEVQEKTFAEAIRTVGRVTYNETRIARIQPKIEGWIEKVYVDYTGKLVKKGQPLLTIYSPQLVSTQQELLIAKKSMDSLSNSPFKEASSGAMSLYEATRERLKLWDISEGQVKEIEKRGTPVRTMTLSSPATGFVMMRNAFPAQRVTPETELYTIADLTSVWVIADIYEYEIPLIRIGQKASMSLTYFPEKTFTGTVSFINPELDKTTRTLKVRIEFSNSELRLKPDMYANVEFQVDHGRQLYVPQEAVLDSGAEQIAFVAREDGYFEPRRIKVGGRVDNHYIVLSGLTLGEKVVTSGNFLIDSESQLKSALGGMTGGGAHAAHGNAAPSGPAEQTQQSAPATQPGDRAGHQPATPAPAREAAPSGKRKILYYQDAMNPAYKSDKPGKAPDGMDLVPVYEDAPAGNHTGHEHPSTGAQPRGGPEDRQHTGHGG
jgi:RND family efflux transporter MFP subunit